MCMQPRAPRYRPRRVGDDVLSQVIDLHLASFIEEVEDRGGCVPRYVQRAFWAYLDCGRPEGGFILLRCDCGKARVLPFSCKNRGFCPSCLGRRMSQLSANIADNVLPSGIPLRQWVLSFPYPLRLWLLWRPKLRKAVLAVVQRLLFRWYERRAAAAGRRAHRGRSLHSAFWRLIKCQSALPYAPAGRGLHQGRGDRRAVLPQRPAAL